jgi:hypothetical protein
VAVAVTNDASQERTPSAATIFQVPPPIAHDPHFSKIGAPVKPKSTMNGNYSYSQHQQPFDRQLHAQPQLIRQHQHRYDDRNSQFHASGSSGNGEIPAPPPLQQFAQYPPPIPLITTATIGDLGRPATRFM